MSDLHVALRVTVRSVFDKTNQRGIRLQELPDAALRWESLGLSALYLDRSHNVDPFVALGACATTTSFLTLGCVLGSNDDHLPSLLAKVATGLDVVAKGRASVIFDGRAGVDDSLTYRYFDERFEIVRAMSRVPAPSFRGNLYQITGAWNEPRAINHDGLPLGLLVDAFEHTLPLATEETSPLDLVAQFGETLEIEWDGVNEQHVVATVDDFLRRCRKAGRLREDVHIHLAGKTHLMRERGQEVRAICHSTGIDGMTAVAHEDETVAQLDDVLALLTNR